MDADPRDALRDYLLAHARWVVLDEKRGPPPEMPPCLREDGPRTNLKDASTTSFPTPCYGRAAERERRVGIWYADNLRTWLWVPESMTQILAITHCPHCRNPLPLMGTNAQSKTWVDNVLGNPDE